MVNRRFSSRQPRHRQQGAAMVEMALTFPLFVLLIFAIIEFALVLFTWTRAVDATRAGSRFVIVEDPVTDLSSLSCPGSVTVTCDNANCGALMNRMTALYTDLQPSAVQVTYRCSSTGFPDRPPELAIREVSVAISGQTYNFILPGLIGIDSTMTLPSFTSTRTSEDMDTP